MSASEAAEGEVGRRKAVSRAGGRYQRWPLELRQRAYALADMGWDEERIAHEIGKSAVAVKRCLTLRERVKPQPTKFEPRACQRCKKRFKPAGRWIFRCDECHRSEAAMAASDPFTISGVRAWR